MIRVRIDKKLGHVIELRNQLLHITCIRKAIPICAFNALKKTIRMVKFTALMKNDELVELVDYELTHQLSDKQG